MHNTHAAQMWHLARGKQQRVLITDHELRLLAQQRRLHPEDLLWRRGFDGWRTAFSIPGLLTPPPLPETSWASVEGEDRLQADATESATTFASKLLEIGTLNARLGTKAISSLRQLLSLGERAAQMGFVLPHRRETQNFKARCTSRGRLRNIAKPSGAPSRSRFLVGCRSGSRNTRHRHAEFLR